MLEPVEREIDALVSTDVSMLKPALNSAGQMLEKRSDFVEQRSGVAAAINLENLYR